MRGVQHSRPAPALGHGLEQRQRVGARHWDAQTREVHQRQVVNRHQVSRMGCGAEVLEGARVVGLAHDAGHVPAGASVSQALIHQAKNKSQHKSREGIRKTARSKKLPRMHRADTHRGELVQEFQSDGTGGDRRGPPRGLNSCTRQSKKRSQRKVLTGFEFAYRHVHPKVIHSGGSRNNPA